MLAAKDMKYTPVIGLEVHVELKTQSKMFCSCSADYFGQQPNTHTCPVCMGLPGALPVPNKTAIEWCLMIGMALNCNIPLVSKFDRKNYFYPDLPKGYQISQYDEPFAINGSLKLKIDDGKTIRIRRVHMEEDTAKLTHQANSSLIDFNRSGVPLVEIVTEPDFETATEVVEYLKKLQQIVRYLGVSNADMEKGDMRLEPNISLRPSSLRGDENDEAISGSPRSARDDKFELPKYKVEVKNINSFRFVEKAINFEIERQAKILDEGKIPSQETRGWDEKKNGTVSQRLKEEANDYRYFPEPDIPPVRWTESQISNLKSQMGESPDAKFTRFKKEYDLSDYDTEILTREQQLADYFEAVILASKTRPESDAEQALRQAQDAARMTKSIANFIINKKVDPNKVSPEELLNQIARTQTVAIDNNELESVIKIVLEESPKAVVDYKAGKETVIMFLLGQVMRKIGKKIDAQMVKEKIISTIK